jgi:hypothetical protein
LRQAVTAREGSPRLGVLSGLPPISLVDMLHARIFLLGLEFYLVYLPSL